MKRVKSLGLGLIWFGIAFLYTLHRQEPVQSIFMELVAALVMAYLGLFIGYLFGLLSK